MVEALEETQVSCNDPNKAHLGLMEVPAETRDSCNRLSQAMSALKGF